MRRYRAGPLLPVRPSGIVAQARKIAEFWGQIDRLLTKAPSVKLIAILHSFVGTGPIRTPPVTLLLETRQRFPVSYLDQ